jgi:hypothetical protein
VVVTPPNTTTSCDQSNVEIGRDDGQTPTLCVLGGDPGEHRSIDMPGDELAQRLIAEYPGAEENGLQARRREEALGDAARVKLTQQAVIGGTQESKGRDQRAGAHSRYDREFGPGPPIPSIR